MNVFADGLSAEDVSAFAYVVTWKLPCLLISVLKSRIHQPVSHMKLINLRSGCPHVCVQSAY